MRINPQCRFQNPRLFWIRLYNYMWRVTVRKQESYENVSGANASYMLKTTLKRILCNSLRVEIEIMQSNFLTENSRTPDKTVETFPQPPPQAPRFSHDRGERGRETRVTGDEAQEIMGRLLLTVHIKRETSGYEADISKYLSISCYETIPSKRNKVAPSPPSVQSCFGLTAHAYISGVRLVTVNNVKIGEGENGLSICYGKHFCQDQCKKYVCL